MSCRRKQCEKHGLEHWKSPRECCRASRETALRKSVWDAVFQEISPLLSPVVPFLAQKTIACFSVPQEPWLLGRKMEPVRAAFFQKRSIMGALRGSNPGKLKKIIFLLPTRVLFLARFRFERRNPRLERRSLSLGCHSPAGLTPGRTATWA